MANCPHPLDVIKGRHGNKRGVAICSHPLGIITNTVTKGGGQFVPTLQLLTIRTVGKPWAAAAARTIVTTARVRRVANNSAC